MGGKRRQRNSRRPRRSGMRSALRRVQQAVTSNITISSTPNDPPPIKIGRVYQTVCEFTVVSPAKNVTASTIAFQNLPQSNVITLKESVTGYESFKLTEDHMYKAFLWGLGVPVSMHDSAKSWYFTSVIKASFWGPLPQLFSSSVAMEYYNGELPIVVSDTGTATSRPKCSVSCARLEWGSQAKEEGNSLAFNITTGGQHADPKTQIGLLRLTVCGRVVTSL